MDDEEQLARAAFDGNVEEVRRLLDAGVPAKGETDDWSPLHAAIENQEFACVRLLIERGANVEREARGMTPLAHAVDIACDGSNQKAVAPEDAPSDIVEYLLSVGADPATAVTIAELYQSEKFLRLLRRAEGAS